MNIVLQCFLKILRYYYIPTIVVADLQAPRNNMPRSSQELLMMKITYSQLYVYVRREYLAIE